MNNIIEQIITLLKGKTVKEAIDILFEAMDRLKKNTIV